MRLRWNPPQALDRESPRLAGRELARLHASDPVLCRRVFIDGKDAAPSLLREVHSLWQVGILERIGPCFRSRVMITSLDDLFIVTDFPEQVAYDQVFPLFGDESLLLARLGLSRDNSVVLDLCCGAGVLAVHAARAGATALGIDIGERAIGFARFNAALNEVADRTCFRVGDLFAGTRDRAIDLVISNPPFVPHPPSVELPLFSSGGEDGLRVVGRVCSSFRDLAPRADLILLAVSLGDETNSTVTRALEQVARNEGSTVEVVQVYPKARADEILSCFEAATGYEPWMHGLRTRGLTWIYYHLVIVTRAPGQSQSSESIASSVGRDIYSGSWKARRRRWQLWMEGMHAKPHPRHERDGEHG